MSKKPQQPRLILPYRDAQGLTMFGDLLSFPSGSTRQEITAPRTANVRRRITPDAGRGLEKLAHALEYLADEFVHDGCDTTGDSGRLQAIQVLARLNREIYFACRVEPTLAERVQRLFHRFLNLN